MTTSDAIPSVTEPRGAIPTTTTAFGGLRIDHDPSVLEPRPWTLLQSDWAAELAPSLPRGPLLELCSGCGYLGLEAARRSGRRAVLVDVSASACRWAAHNARANGLGEQVVVRHGPIGEVLGEAERFPLVLADPPYVPAGDLWRYPADPHLAIDGGEDGLMVVREVLAALGGHLEPGGVALLQLRGPDQAAAVAGLPEVARLGLRAGEVRTHDRHRAVLSLTRAADA